MINNTSPQRKDRRNNRSPLPNSIRFLTPRNTPKKISITTILGIETIPRNIVGKLISKPVSCSGDEKPRFQRARGTLRLAQISTKRDIIQTGPVRRGPCRMVWGIARISSAHGRQSGRRSSHRYS
jgi:hypothetical protein